MRKHKPYAEWRLYEGGGRNRMRLISLPESSSASHQPSLHQLSRLVDHLKEHNSDKNKAILITNSYLGKSEASGDNSQRPLRIPHQTSTRK